MTGVTIRERAFPGFRSLAVVAVAGAAVGTAWDFFHVHTHTSVYASGLGHMPFWVPLEFATVYVVGVAGITLLGSPRPSAASPASLVRETLWVTAVYATTAMAHRYESLVVAACLVALIVRARTLRDVVRATPIPAVALIVSGPVVESVLIAAHVFRYTHASLGNIPVWLPLLYANAVPFAVRLAETALWFDRPRAAA